MKKLIFIALLLLLCLAGCSSGTRYQDGIYLTQSDDYDSEGWMDAVIIDVEKGKIIDVEWTAFHESGDLELKRITPELLPQNGILDWQAQADKVSAALVQMQDISSLTGEGSGDVLNGVTIPIDEFVHLVNRALELAK